MLLITLIIPTIFREDDLNSLRRLTRRGDPSVFIRAMSRARKFGANLTSDNFNVTKTYLEKCNAIKVSAISRRGSSFFILPNSLFSKVE